jgi:hypothetical protein
MYQYTDILVLSIPWSPILQWITWEEYIWSPILQWITWEEFIRLVSPCYICSPSEPVYLSYDSIRIYIGSGFFSDRIYICHLGTTYIIAVVISLLFTSIIVPWTTPDCFIFNEVNIRFRQLVLNLFVSLECFL